MMASRDAMATFKTLVRILLPTLVNNRRDLAPEVVHQRVCVAIDIGPHGFSSMQMVQATSRTARWSARSPYHMGIVYAENPMSIRGVQGERIGDALRPCCVRRHPD